MIQLIVSDIDSTLIDHIGYLPPENVAALSAARRRGVRLVLATVRKRDSAEYIAEQLGGANALICNSGATIFDAQGAVLRALTIPLATAQAVAALADQHGLPLLATIDEQNYYRPGAQPAAHIKAQGQDVALMLPVMTQAPSRLIMRGEVGAALLMREFSDAGLRFARHYHADGTLADLIVTHADATKEAALRFVCDTWGIALADVLALGDAEADIGMLQQAGVGVAVGNAHPEVRAIANWVAPSAGEGGVAAAVERYCVAP
jgi:HAD superfamily hydrolase (TIGR01484 family)